MPTHDRQRATLGPAGILPGCADIEAPGAGESGCGPHVSLVRPIAALGDDGGEDGGYAGDGLEFAWEHISRRGSGQFDTGFIQLRLSYLASSWVVLKLTFF